MFCNVSSNRYNADTAELTHAKVRADFLPDGRLIPLIFRVGDGPAILIDRILDVRQAASLKSGGHGTRYTCVAEDRHYYLFYNGKRWLVEPVTR